MDAGKATGSGSGADGTVPQELAALGWGLGVDRPSLLVDHDMMVIPAHGDQVVRIVSPACRIRDEMMRLQPCLGLTAGDHTPMAVTLDDPPADRSWNRP